MTTESLCAIERTNKQLQDPRQQVKEPEDFCDPTEGGDRQTTIRGRTKSFTIHSQQLQLPSEVRTEQLQQLCAVQQAAGGVCECTGAEGRSLEVCDISRDNNDADDNSCAEQEQSRHSGQLKVDCRSILTNKQRLKRFWEAKMEMEFKLKRQQQEAQEPQSKQAGVAPKLRSSEGNLDENNNSDEPEGVRESDASSPSEPTNGDANWKSLSPNELERPPELEPTSASSQKQQAQLVCDKLREYQRLERDRRRAEEAGECKELSGAGKGPTPPAGTRIHMPNGTDESQLMSIDPTLCHPSQSGAGSQEGVEDETESGAGAGSGAEREEQTVNEEFSSSSSSFGPMSISVPLGGQSPADWASDESAGQPNSAQSGSVLTVIANLEQSLGEAPESGARMVSESEEPLEGQAAQPEEQQESSSNIGVAFESLHFDSEIKSSKQEEVEPERLLSPRRSAERQQPQPALTQPQAPHKFNANEVKSVCNLINAAISDATRQVESFMRRASSPDAGEARAETPSSSIQRATFVTDASDRLSPAMDACRVDEPDEEELSAGADTQPPQADLSSIFEANVRREIERFESNSVPAERPSKLAAARGGLTEWRIAEEIRQFTERELELKHRTCSGAGGQHQQLAPEAKESANKHDQHAAIIRFGKMLQIPKPVSCPPVAAETPVQAQQQLGKAIRLSTTSPSSVCGGGGGGGQSTTTISMHKFIASGGKKFVFTSSPQQTGSSGLQSGHQMAKSLSNLSQLARPADYKAVDSLRCKETPNVKPGLTRQAIATFSRLVGEPAAPVQVLQASQSQLAGGQPVAAAPTNMSSAERKIQEELREMRTREAELRDQRRQLVSLHLQQQQPNGSADLLGGQRAPDELASQTVGASSSDDCRLVSASSESLYPIRQAIDSFRKLNTQASSQPHLQQQANGRARSHPQPFQLQHQFHKQPQASCPRHSQPRAGSNDTS